MRLSKALQPAATLAWAARHPVRAMKHLALHSTQAGDVMDLDELAMYASAGSFTSSGKQITTDSVLRVSSAWRAVQIIAGTCGSLPLHLMERTDGVPRKAVEHPLYRTLRARPSEYQTSISFIEQLAMSLALWNQAYIWAPGFGSRRSLYALGPTVVRRSVVDRGLTGKQRFQVSDGTLGSRELSLGEIIPIDGFRMPGALEGMAVAGMHREAFSLALAAEEFGARFFATGGRPTGLLSTESVLKKEQREQLRESFKELLLGQGVENMGKLHVLEGGMKYQAISTAPDDSQFLQTRKHAVLETSRIFGVPAHMLGELDRATYANAEQNNREFLQYTLRPYLIRIEAAINNFLIPEDEQGRYFVEFNVEGLLRGDSAARADFYQKARTASWMTPNEIRAKENLPPVEGGDDLHVPMNMAPLDQLRSINEKE